MTDDNTQGQAAPGGAQVPEAPDNDNNQQTPPPEGQGIQNPEAYYKAQAEKFQRLHSKAETDIATVKAQLESLQGSQAEALQKKLDELTGELETQKSQAEADRVDAMRMKALAAAKLDPETMLEFVTATDTDGIKAQVEKLAGFASPTQQRGSHLGNAGDGGQAVDLSWLPGHPNYSSNDAFGGGGVFTNTEE